jgi:hypothetical protein
MGTETEVANLRPAVTILVGGVTGMLLADVWLMARGFAPITAGLRHRHGKVFVVLLLGHVLDVLGPFDPFRSLGWLGRRLSPL